jgi:hypothetical protein
MWRIECLSRLVFAGCATALLSACSTVHFEHKIPAQLNESQKVGLIVDVCVRQDAVGDEDDYVMVEESKLASSALASNLASEMQSQKLGQIVTITPFVCASNTPKAERVLEAGSKTASMIAGPYGVDEKLVNEKDYLTALERLVGAFRIPVRPNEARQPPKVSKPNSEAPAQDSAKEAVNEPISSELVLDALTLVKQRASLDSVVVVSTNGVSVTAGKAAAQFAGSMFVGLATAAISGGTVIHVPVGGARDGSFTFALLIDNKKAVPLRTGVSFSTSNPAKVDSWRDKSLAAKLIHGLTHIVTKKPAE